MQKIVGIGEMAISNNIEDTIKTFALASCVAVVAYSPVKKIGGMVHLALPKSPRGQEGVVKCCYYVLTGMPYFIGKLCRNYGCVKEELIISLYGGADSVKNTDVFNIGRKNLEAVKNVLKEMNMKFDDRETGKKVSRTIELAIGTGKVNITYQNIKI
jgi:chemotaxis protein CheD